MKLYCVKSRLQSFLCLQILWVSYNNIKYCCPSLCGSPKQLAAVLILWELRKDTVQIRLHIIKGSVNNRVYTNHSCDQPHWAPPLVVITRIFSPWSSHPWHVALYTAGTHKLSLELISPGSWHLHLLDISSPVKGRGQMKTMQPASAYESMAGCATGVGWGGVTEAPFLQSR